ncbi:MAG TPA: hypothetical protein VFB93_20845 [Burkholderiales bacterium]|nr:hypothetical protein [Burkholderiales bacterium]
MPKKKSGRELLFVAECEGGDGRPESYWVHKSGRSFYITGPNFQKHLCHPSVQDAEGVKREILLVFHATVKTIKLPGQLGS